ncbi:MAG: hypothetical protein PVF35_06785 [Gammaproteobacteria bacterium]
MIKVYSQRLMPPYSGQVQIAESEQARAVTMDMDTWEIQFRRHETNFIRVAWVKHSDLGEVEERALRDGEEIDDRILELTRFLETASLPFPAADKFEYWLLDPVDESPLALIFSCTEGSQMANFPSHPEWTALPAAVMPIELTPEEKERSDTPVNYRLEQLVTERAGSKPRARWFQRRPGEPDQFPPLMIREDWEEEAHHEICQRYLRRQSTRLLMLHGLEHHERKRLEKAAKSYAMEVFRFYSLYPEFADDKLMRSILVEARLRASRGEQDNRLQRRDGVFYL